MVTLQSKRIQAKKNPRGALTPQRFGALSMPESFYYESLEDERVVTALISSVHRYSLDTEKSQGTLPMFFRSETIALELSSTRIHPYQLQTFCLQRLFDNHL